MKKLFAMMLALVMVLAAVPVLGATEDPTTEGDISKSKKATELVNDETTITLSLPAEKEEQNTDIVFVLDKSTSTTIETKALEMLAAIKDACNGTNASVKVGIVIFNKVANIANDGCFFDLATQYTEIENAIKEKISSGTNTHAGLLAGKQMLDADTSVSADRKFMIFVSDGITYQFCRDNDYTKAYTRSFDGGLHENGVNQCGTLSELNIQYKLTEENPIPMGNITDWVTNISGRIGTENDKQEWDYEYTGKPLAETNKLLKDKQNVSNVEKALYLTKGAYQAAQDAGYNVYAVKATTDKEGIPYIWGNAFMEHLAGGKTISMEDIKNNIMFILRKGTTIVDVMGVDFDFVNDPAKIKVKFAGDELETVNAGNNRYEFKDKNEKVLFSLTYNGEDDKFEWKIEGEDIVVSTFQRVEIIYNAKLVNKSAVPGTYSLPTNKEAYVMKGDANDLFEVPYVNYAVSVEPDPWYPPYNPTPVQPVQPVQPAPLPPQTGDMPLWYAVAHFLGLVK